MCGSAAQWATFRDQRLVLEARRQIHPSFLRSSQPQQGVGGAGVKARAFLVHDDAASMPAFGIGLEIVFDGNPVRLTRARTAHHENDRRGSRQPVLQVLFLVDIVEAVSGFPGPGALGRLALHLQNAVGHAARLLSRISKKPSIPTSGTVDGYHQQPID